MAKKRPVYEQPEFLSADPEIAGFAERYLAIRGTTPRTREAYHRQGSAYPLRQCSNSR